jgi:hypothetical protein
VTGPTSTPTTSASPAPSKKRVGQPKRSHPGVSHRVTSAPTRTHPHRTPSAAQTPGQTQPTPIATNVPAAQSTHPRPAVAPTPARSPEARPQTHARVRPARSPAPARHARAHAPHASASPKPQGIGSTESSGSTPWIAIGAGVLAAGVVALFGVFAVADIRRRRAVARSRRR